MSVRVAPLERRATSLAFACYFALFASYYILRPVRDTVATIFGAAQLQDLFTATFVGSFIASPLYAALAARVRLTRLLPGVFWFWLANVLLFAALLQRWPDSRAVAAAYYVWFSVVNLFMVSVFWSLMVDLFSPSQATRLFAIVAAGGSLGSIVGPLVTRAAVTRLGLPGLLLLAAAGFVVVIGLFHALMREKRRFAQCDAAQRSTLEHALPGNPFAGFGELFASPLARRQAWFMLMMTWVATVAYFFQTDLIGRSIPGIAGRAQAIADIDLAVNVVSALILLFGLGRVVQRFGVTTGLTLNPLAMIVAFIAIAAAPSLWMIQGLQVVRRVGQYAIARPSREICFTVVEQTSRYKTKNVIDTVVYRFGDLSSAWMQTGLRAAGLSFGATALVGAAASAVWAFGALALGRRYEALRKAGVPESRSKVDAI